MVSTRTPIPQPGTLHAGPAASFEQPFEMLHACHQRVQRSLALLLRLHAHLQQAGADAQAAQAAQDVLRYFDLAGPQHHQDEERHVLPRLRAMGQAVLADRLHADHADLATTWAEVRAVLLRVQAGHWLADADWQAAQREAWQRFAAAYAEHIALEEGVAFPAASAGLSAVVQQAIGQEMARRRGAVQGG